MRFVQLELVIFDCDGVLVDTEPVSNTVMAGAISAVGVPMTGSEVAKAFEGMRLEDIAREVENQLGSRLPPGWVDAFEERRATEFRNGVQAIPGVVTALETIAAAGIRVCIASQASRQKMELTLGLSGLLDRFESDALFSSRMVERGKPHPELFLLAAREMGSDPFACAVVEDGALGVRAARSAGMDALGYAPDGDSERLAREGARTFETMTELPRLLGLT